MEAASETMQPVDIHELLGAGIRAARERKGWRQEDAARAFRFNGLATWRRSTVAAVEAGRRRPSIGDLLLVALTLNVTIADLVPADDEWVDLGTGASMNAAEIRALLSDDKETLEKMPIEQAPRVPGDAWLAEVYARDRAEERRLRPLLQPVIDARGRRLTANDLIDARAPTSEAEARAAAALDVEPAVLKLAARKLWGHNYEDERNARASRAADALSGAVRAPPPTAVQARRGHAARAMLAELRDFLDKASRGQETGE